MPENQLIDLSGGCDFLREDEDQRDMPCVPIDPLAFDYLVLSISRATLQMPALRVLMVGIGALGFARGADKLYWDDGDREAWIECLGAGEKSAPMRYRQEKLDASQKSDEAKFQVYRRWRVWLDRNLH